MIYSRLIVQFALIGVTSLCHAETIVPPLWLQKDDNVKTVQWLRHGEPIQWAVTDMNFLSPLTLSFDIIEDISTGEIDTPWLRARLLHRNFDWTPDGLFENEYLDGFNIADIGRGEPAVPGLTTVDYNHYEVDLSKLGLNPKISGNFILEIFDETNPDKTILSVPFMIEEQNSNIFGTVSGITDRDFKAGHQQLKLDIDVKEIDPRVHRQDMKIVAGQNNSPTTWRVLPFPDQVMNGRLSFNHSSELIFDAGNEYRRFETTNNQYPGMNVEKVAWIDPFYHHLLEIDQPRFDKNYLFDYTQNGRFKIATFENNDPSLAADYVVVHFFLDLPRQTKPVYIEGDFTGRELSPSNIMHWDATNQLYTKSFLLKQGSYNYKYITEEDYAGSNQLEGNFSDTDNLYNVAVYYLVPGERTHRLSSAAIVNTNQH
ncbi:MAG: DUF5103 domain-containing protein [Muribaculaceae bacterium]|nr:DUF5103 domain-containing protein [Muribaculaceae bacterium]